MTTEPTATAGASALELRIAAAKRAVLAQTGFLHREFGRVESRWKSDGTRVTAADIAISEGIIGELGSSFPEDQYFSEELAATPAPTPVTSRFSWVLDPIDGTNNFALGIPHCAISLALMERGEPAYGVVYDLSRKSLIHGGPGIGLWDGDRPAGPSSGPLNLESLVGLHSPSDKSLTPKAAAVMSRFKTRGLGTATLHLAYVAIGLFDGCVDFNVKIWDLAAAIALVRAGGAEVRFQNGEQLPMRQFDIGMKRIFYLSGRKEVCDLLEGLLNGAAPR